METALKNDIYERLALAWTGTAGRDNTVECVVPDTLPDVGSIVDEEGVLTLRSKETETGSVSLAASVSVSVMYMPESGGGMESLAVSVPVEIRMDAPGADNDCWTVARLRVRAVDAKLLNSRKVSVRADVMAEVWCYRKQSLELPSGMEQADGIHLLTKTVSLASVADVREKTFVVTDEYALPTGCRGVSRLLGQQVETAVEDVKYVSGKVVFRGRIRVGLIFGDADGEHIHAGRYETEFSQIMEMDAMEGEVMADIILMLTGVYFDLPEQTDDNGRVAVEMHMAAQCLCRRMQEMTYIADLYSNRTVLTGRREDMELVSAVSMVSMRQTVTGSLESAGAAWEVLTLSAGIGNITMEEETVKTSVNIRAICRQSDGQYTLSRCRLAVEFTTDLPAGARLENVSVTVTDVYYTAAGGGMDVRATLQMDATALTMRTLSPVTEVVEDAEAWASAPPAPSLILARVEQGADMWAVAQKYHSTAEAIAAANGERTSGLLLIPKSR